MDANLLSFYEKETNYESRRSLVKDERETSISLGKFKTKFEESQWSSRSLMEAQNSEFFRFYQLGNSFYEYKFASHMFST